MALNGSRIHHFKNFVTHGFLELKYARDLENFNDMLCLAKLDCSDLVLFIFSFFSLYTAICSCGHSRPIQVAE